MPAPLEFDQATADIICERLAAGESLRAICGLERDDSLPGQNTVYKWLDENSAFAKQYASARARQADSKFDEADEIAKAATVENVQVARLQIDTIKWQASKLAPKKYGEKVELEHSGAIQVTKVEREIVRPSHTDS